MNIKPKFNKYLDPKQNLINELKGKVSSLSLEEKNIFRIRFKLCLVNEKTGEITLTTSEAINNMNISVLKDAIEWVNLNYYSLNNAIEKIKKEIGL